MANPKACAALLFCAATALYTLDLGQSTLWSKDETTYADIARHILRSGDWITLHWNGRPWLNHPPLFYWLMAADFHLLGIHELAARLPAALFGAAGVTLTYIWGLTLLTPPAALYAALAQMLNVQYFLESRMAIIDTAFLFFLSVALLGFWRGWQEKRPGFGLLFAGCGLACLTKGPWGLVFPFVVIIPFAAVQGRLKALRGLGWAWGAPLALLLGGTWYVVEIFRHGNEFAGTVLGYYFLGRVTLAVEHQSGPVWMYVPVLFAGLLPWSFLLPSAVRSLWLRRSAGGIFILCWIAVPFLGLSLASTKLPSYAAFVYTPCALAVGAWIDTAQRRRLAMPLGLAGLFALGLAAAMRLWAETHVDAPLAAIRAGEMAYLWMAIGLAAAVGTCFVTRVNLSPTLPVCAGVLGCLLTVATAVVPALEPARSLAPLCQEVNRVGRDGDNFAIYGPGVFGIIYYADRGPMVYLQNTDQLTTFVRDARRALVIMRRSTYNQLTPDLRGRLPVVAATERDVIARTP